MKENTVEAAAIDAVPEPLARWLSTVASLLRREAQDREQLARAYRMVWQVQQAEESLKEAERLRSSSNAQR